MIGTGKKGRFLVDACGCTPLVAAFLVVIGLFTAIGQISPTPLSVSQSQEVTVCSGESANTTSCGACEDVQIEIRLEDIQELHQFVRVNFVFAQPFNKGGALIPTENVQGGFSLQAFGLDKASGSEHQLGDGSSLDKHRSISCEDGVVENKEGVEISLVGSTDRQFCEPLQLVSLNLVKYDAYLVKLAFKDGWVSQFCSFEEAIPAVRGVFFMEFNAPSFSKFEMIFKYSLIGIALLFLGFYTYGVSQLARSTYEQKWTIALLVGLVAFNDPFSAVEIVLQVESFQVLYLMFSITFLAVLLFFLLLTPSKIRSNANAMKQQKGTLHGASKVVSSLGDLEIRSMQTSTVHSKSSSNLPAMPRQPESFCCRVWRDIWAVTSAHLGKFLLCVLCWGTAFGLELFLFLKQRSDPSFDPSQDLGLFYVSIILIGLVLGFYGCWVIFLLGTGVTLRRYVKHSDLFLFCLNVITLVFLGVGTALGSILFGSVENGLSMVLLHGVVNGYVWMLAVAFYPSAEAFKEARKIKKMELEDIAYEDNQVADEQHVGEDVEEEEEEADDIGSDEVRVETYEPPSAGSVASAVSNMSSLSEDSWATRRGPSVIV